MFNLRIHTLEKTLFDGDVESAQVPGPTGELGILSYHIPLITPLISGQIKIRKKLAKRYEKADEEIIEIKKGFLEVKPNQVVILAEK
jgi:F-type H+-transporting ATPase subunit epsilon